MARGFGFQLGVVLALCVTAFLGIGNEHADLSIFGSINPIGIDNIFRGQEENKCAMTYMRPYYIPISLSGVSVHEDKYRLFRYHEDSRDPPSVCIFYIC